MGALDGVIKSLDLERPEKPGSMRDDALESFAKEMRVQAQALQVAIGSMNNIAETQARQLDAARELMARIADLSGALAANRRDLEKALDLGERLEAMSGDLAGLPAKFPKIPRVDIPDHSGALEALTSAVQGVPGLVNIPETDLSPVIDALLGIMEKLDDPMVVDAPPRREWEFEIEREAFSDKIKTIHAKEVV